MASSVHTHSKQEIINGNLILLSDSGIKLMLLKNSYDAVDDPDVDFIDSGGADDPIDHEADCSGYAGGFGNTGRKALANRAINRDDTNNVVWFDFDDVAFGNLGNGVNNQLGGAGLIKEITSDAASPFIAWDDTGDKLTNGGTITYQVAASGMIQF